MNWQVKTYVWGRSIPGKEDLDPGDKRINRIYYIHSGDAWTEINGVRSCLQPGWLYILPETLRVYIGMSEENPMDHTFFDFDVIPCFRFQHVMGLEVSKYPVIGKMLETLQELYYENRERRYSKELMDVVNSMLPNLIWMISQVENFSSATDLRILDTLFFIHDNLDKELTTDLLCGRIFLEESYFIRLFTKNTGQTPYQYIRSRRMHLAKALIEKGEAATETAGQCGYTCYSAFSRAFKQYYGYPPRTDMKRKN